MNPPNTCKRGCCWTPHGVCARQHQCHHHTTEREEQTTRQMRDTLRRELEGRRR